MIRIRPGWYDALGAALAAAFAAWIVVSAAARTGNPWPQIALVVASVASYVIGRTLGGRRPVFVAAIIVVTILAGTVASGPAALSGAALAPPLGYGNANGALFTLGVAAACVVAQLANKEPVRLVAGVLAVVLLGLAVATLSKTAALLAGGILLIAMVAHRLGRWIALVAPVVVAATVAATVVLGLTHGSPPSMFEELSERRTLLWREAMDITADEPVFGVGPGMFAQTSPTALADTDARWAHSAYLQIGAETGAIGVTLLGMLILWIFGSLYRSQQDERLIAIGTAAVAALAIHAAIDYVAHFPAIVVIGAILAGIATGRMADDPLKEI